MLHLAGTPQEMGRQHGMMLRRLIPRVLADLINGEAPTPAHYQTLISGARVMARYLPPEFRRELRALAGAAQVDYDELLAAQLFGDVWRGLPGDAGGIYCTSYAVFGPATSSGECIVGRNMDYWDHGIAEYGMVLLHYTPDRGLPFVTASWAGIINGWTAMNSAGIVVANNTASGARANSLHGLSTCFMLRKVAQYARTVAEGVEIIKNTPRAVGTNMIVAGGDPPAAAIVEYDHEQVEVRWAQDGVVCAANEYQQLYQSTNTIPQDDDFSRYSTLGRLIRENYGHIDRTMNFAAAPGVPISSSNLQCALLFPADLSFKIAMGSPPAHERPFRHFRMTAHGLELQRWWTALPGEIQTPLGEQPGVK